MASTATVRCSVILMCATVSLAAPNSNSKGGEPNNVGLEQRMLLPEGYTIPDYMFGPNYIWDTKGWPREADSTSETRISNIVPKNAQNEYPISLQNSRSSNNVRNPANDSPIIFRDDPVKSYISSEPHIPSRNSANEMTNAWWGGNGIEQRMLLKEGQTLPEDMYGPNYIWDKKGWPRYVDSNVVPDSKSTKTAVKGPGEADSTSRTRISNTVPKNTQNSRSSNNAKNPPNDSPIIFRDDPVKSYISPEPHIPSRNSANEMTNAWWGGNGIEQRILLKEGQTLPEDMYGPNYIWDKKGWPRYVDPNIVPDSKSAKTAVKGGNDRPIVFRN